MKAISVLGTSSNSGKSWLATALCALLRRKGLKVAPFKAQNMSNNSFVTLDGGEIGRAQAAQAEACGLEPIVEMNPILLKPSGRLGSQLVLLGHATEHIEAAEYYELVEKLWPIVCETLEFWSKRCDVLILEGAGSPVELNLMGRDIVNLRPIHHLDGRWMLVADIERGGVFAQIIGTWSLLEPVDRVRGLGVVVNKFRGDLSLFADARRCLSEELRCRTWGSSPSRLSFNRRAKIVFAGNPKSGVRGIPSPGSAFLIFPIRRIASPGFWIVASAYDGSKRSIRSMARK